MGTVEIRTDDGWIEVCDEDWDNVDAKVLCREMGFKDGIGETGSVLGVEQNPNSEPNKAFTQFNCVGNEKQLVKCKHQTLTSKCHSRNRASAICYDKSAMDVDQSKLIFVRVNLNFIGTLSGGVTLLFSFLTLPPAYQGLRNR